MKFKSVFLSLFILTCFQSAVIAQNAFPIPDLKGALGIEAGDYKFYDPTQVQIKELEEAFKRSESDKEFYYQYIQEINDQALELIKVIRAPKNSLAQMSQDSLAGAGAADHIAYLEKVRDFMTRKESLLLKARTIATTMEALAPSKLALQSDEAEKQIDEVPQYSNINFSPATAIYETTIANLEAYAANLGYKLKLRNNTIEEIAPNQGQGLNLQISYIVYSDEELDEIQDNIKLWREYDRKQMQSVSNFATYGRQRIQNFIEQFGSKEKYRPRNNEALKTMSEIGTEISNFFFVRDAARAVYGLPLGAIYATYESNWFKLDRLKLGHLVEFQSQLAYSDADLDTLSRNYMEALQTAKAQRERVTKAGQAADAQDFDLLEMRISEAEEDLSLQIANGSTGVLSKVNSFGQMLLGRRPLVDTYYFMLRMLLADVVSERTLRNEGQAAMIERFKQRYRNDQEHKDYFDDLYKKYFGTPNSGNGRPTRGIGDGSMTAGSQSLTKAISDLKLLASRKQNDLTRAWQQELLLWQASVLGDSGNDVSNEAEDSIFGDD